MYRKRRRLKLVKKMTTSGAWERKYMANGLFAASALATIAAIVWFAVAFPMVAASVFFSLVLLAVVATYILAISRDIDFNGDMRE